MRHKKIALYILLLFVLALTGLFSGRIITDFFMQHAVEKKIMSSSMRIDGNIYFEMNHYLNNADELKRLAGYYLLYDIKKIDVDFLTQRFSAEKSFVHKRTILWLLSFSDETGKVLEFYQTVKEKACKKDIAKYKKRLQGGLEAIYK